MNGSELDRKAALRAKVRQLIADLRWLGVTTEQMRGKSLVELDEMRARAMLRLQSSAPESEKAV